VKNCGRKDLLLTSWRESFRLSASGKANKAAPFERYVYFYSTQTVYSGSLVVYPCLAINTLTAMDTEIRDKHGAVVRVGTRVRVLKISDLVLSQLPESEADAARSMEGEVLEVYEIDEWGGAWVEQTWRASDGTSVSHSLGLGPEQMEVVPNPGKPSDSS
jgi:hypothetical protein